MTSLELEILKILIDNNGEYCFTKLFNKIKSGKNRDAFQRLMDLKYVAISFVDPLNSTKMIAEISFWGIDAYNKEMKNVNQNKT